MANAPLSPQSIDAPRRTPDVLEYADVPPTGVRKVLGAYEERELQRVRWGAVIAGLFIAIGTQILLGALGAAIGLSRVDPTSPRPFEGLGLGAGIWMSLASLISLFVGGYAAAKLGGSIRRADGVLAGILTWATSLVLALWLVGTTAAGAASSVIGLSQSTSPQTREMVTPDLPRTPAEAQRQLDTTARSAASDAARGAWYAFGGALLSLLSAMLGGAMGAVGRLGTPIRELRHKPGDVDAGGRRVEVQSRVSDLEGRAREGASAAADKIRDVVNR